ncbi:YihY/virulence factor BrkB family protein [Povalibacter sp.]|uniref:YihY/virulence factor BrkB family protein n=1 Tax=Povalibacter sp. TaxID=1962978 RepID=UPI002F3EF13D
MSHVRKIWSHLTCAAKHWSQDQAATLGAALAFYCAFSLAPLLIILVTLTGWIIGTDAAYANLAVQLRSLFGNGTAQILLDAMHSSQDSDGPLATVISLVSLLVGATTVFAALETALEQIWGARAHAPRGIYGFLRARLLSFGFILAVGFLLLVSLSITTALAGIRGALAQRYEALLVAVTAVDLLVSTVLITGMIGVIYRYLPARRLPWKSALIGALLTAMLFQAGRWLVGFYLGRATQPSAFGAAASFAAMLLWLYYTAQIFLFGAEFTACIGNLRLEQKTEGDSRKGEHAN